MTPGWMKHLDWHWYVTSDYQPVGYNYELADIDNPRGAIIRLVHYLVCESYNGHRYITGNSYTQDTEYELCDIAEFNNEYNVLPNLNYERETYPVYGSQVYVEGDWEHEQLEYERNNPS